MKRFSLIVSLAACLVLILGANAFAQYSMTIESKTASQNQTNVNVDVTGTWAVQMAAFTLPVVVRELDAGSFWTGTLPCDTVDGVPTRVDWKWPAPWAFLIQEFRPGTPAAPCATNGDVAYEGITPDHFAINAAGAGTKTAAQTADYNWISFQFDVTGTPGDFEFDTACFTSSLNTIYMTDAAFPPGEHGGECVFTKGVITILPNLCPDPIGAYGASTTGTEGDALSMAWDGTSYNDAPDNDAARFYLVSGPGGVNETTGLWTWNTGCCDAGTYTVEIEVADAAHVGGGNCPGILSFTVIVNAYPIGIDCGAPLTVHFGQTAATTVDASTICNPTFAGEHVDAAGNFSWLTTCQDLGTHVFTMTATDDCQRTETCDVSVTVTNDPPECGIPNYSFLFSEGYDIDLATVVSDPDNDGLIFSNLTITPTPSNVPTLVGSMLSWAPAFGDAGNYAFTVDVTDGCEGVTCEWTVKVTAIEGYKVSILDPFDEFGELKEPGAAFTANADHYVHVLNGRNATVALTVQTLTGFSDGMGAFDFLLCYDCSVLNFLKAEKGDGIAGWEYFTYRYGAFGNNCGTGCPSCYIRVIGIRDMNNGVAAPAGSEIVDGYAAYLTFFVSEDRSFIGMCPRIGFCSIDCGDNVISNASGDSLALAYSGQNYADSVLITFGPDYILNDCLTGFKGAEPKEFVWFDPGYICIVPPTDDRGDINLNGISNEVADAVLYTNYFIFGPDVWQIDAYYENRVLASDINDDGIVATVADLVYLIRIITGDAQPFPNSGESKVNPYSSAMDVGTEMVDGQLVVTTNSSSNLGAGHLVFNYTGVIGVPTTNSDMTVRYNAENGKLRVLIYSMAGNSVEAGVTDLVSIPVDGMVELVEASFSDASGSLMTSNLHRVEPPKAYELMQNYPNPFNASTMIRFALKNASDWSMKIYNVAGQVVETFEGSADAGYVTVNWNADVASGIYFYKLQAGDFTATKKMVLMK